MYDYTKLSSTPNFSRSRLLSTSVSNHCSACITTFIYPKQVHSFGYLRFAAVMNRQGKISVPFPFPIFSSTIEGREGYFRYHCFDTWAQDGMLQNRQNQTSARAATHWADGPCKSCRSQPKSVWSKSYVWPIQRREK